MDFPINSYIRDACIISHISLHEEKEAYVILQLKQNEIGDRKGSIALLLQNNIEWLTFSISRKHIVQCGFRNNGTMLNDCACKESNYATKMT